MNSAISWRKLTAMLMSCPGKIRQADKLADLPGQLTQCKLLSLSFSKKGKLKKDPVQMPDLFLSLAEITLCFSCPEFLSVFPC